MGSGKACPFNTNVPSTMAEQHQRAVDHITVIRARCSPDDLGAWPLARFG